VVLARAVLQCICTAWNRSHSNCATIILDWAIPEVSAAPSTRPAHSTEPHAWRHPYTHIPCPCPLPAGASNRTRAPNGRSPQSLPCCAAGSLRDQKPQKKKDVKQYKCLHIEKMVHICSIV
jgi:hypothetical protein